MTIKHLCSPFLFLKLFCSRLSSNQPMNASEYSQLVSQLPLVYQGNPSHIAGRRTTSHSQREVDPPLLLLRPSPPCPHLLRCRSCRAIRSAREAPLRCGCTRCYLEDGHLFLPPSIVCRSYRLVENKSFHLSPYSSINLTLSVAIFFGSVPK